MKLAPICIATALLLAGCAAGPASKIATTTRDNTKDEKTEATPPASLPDGVVYQPGEVQPLLAVPHSVGKLNLEYVFRHADSQRGDLYIYGGDVLMHPEVGVVPLDVQLATAMQFLDASRRAEVLRNFYEGLRAKLVENPAAAAPEDMQVRNIRFLREEVREATWTQRNAAGVPVREESLPAIYSVYDLEFAGGGSARSYFWLSEYSGHILRIKMTEIPYPGLEENFISFARQVTTAVFRGTGHTGPADAGTHGGNNL